jgi:hypothetical protein
MNEEKHEGARVLYELEMGLWEVGLWKLTFDEEHDLSLAGFSLDRLPSSARGPTGKRPPWSRSPRNRIALVCRNPVLLGG